MPAGRPKIPIAERIARLKGEDQKRLPPLPFAWENPFDPVHEEDAHWAWTFAVEDCSHRGVLANGDRNLIYFYCVFYQRAVLAAKEWAGAMICLDDMGVSRSHPALRVQDASWDRMLKIGAMLGLDPINRNKPLMVGSAELGIADGTSPATIDLVAYARDRLKPPPWEREPELNPSANPGSDDQDAG